MTTAATGTARCRWPPAWLSLLLPVFLPLAAGCSLAVPDDARLAGCQAPVGLGPAISSACQPAGDRVIVMYAMVELPAEVVQKLSPADLATPPAYVVVIRNNRLQRAGDVSPASQP